MTTYDPKAIVRLPPLFYARGLRLEYPVITRLEMPNIIGADHIAFMDSLQSQICHAFMMPKRRTVTLEDIAEYRRRLSNQAWAELYLGKFVSEEESNE